MTKKEEFEERFTKDGWHLDPGQVSDNVFHWINKNFIPKPKTPKLTVEGRRESFKDNCFIWHTTKNMSLELAYEFFDYWTEMNPNGKKMRFEMERVFDINRRMNTWIKRSNYINRYMSPQRNNQTDYKNT